MEGNELKWAPGIIQTPWFIDAMFSAFAHVFMSQYLNFIYTYSHHLKHDTVHLEYNPKTKTVPEGGNSI
jgi:hypothetical protein